METMPAEITAAVLDDDYKRFCKVLAWMPANQEWNLTRVVLWHALRDIEELKHQIGTPVRPAP